MDKNFLNILEQLNIDKLHYSNFENSKCLGDVYNKNNRVHTIRISNDEPFKPQIYFLLLESFNNFLNKNADEKVQVALYIECLKCCNDNKLLKDYVNFFMDSKYPNDKSLKFIEDEPINIRNNVVTLTYNSIVLEESLKMVQKKLELFIRAAGFKHLSVSFIYLEPEDVIFDYEKDKQEYDNRIFQRFTELKEKEEQEKAKNASLQNKDGNFPRRPSFKNANFVKVELDNIPSNVTDIESEVKIFDVKPEGKSGKRYKLNCTNYKTSYTIHCFTNKTNTPDYLNSLLNKWCIIKGTVSYNTFDKEESIDLYSIEPSSKEDEIINDDANEKRIELHAHTNMSAMDGISTAESLISTAARYGHKAVAITDHVAVQSFPAAQKMQKKLKDKGIDIKIIYGCELNVAPRALDITTNPKDLNLKDATYVFFDLETSGLSCVFDEIIEFGAVKVKDNEEIGRMDILIKPSKPVSAFTTKLTNISNELLSDKPSIAEVLPKIKEFLGDCVLVAHNGSFDIGFLEQAFKEKITNPTIDTLPLSRFVYPNEKRFNLGSLCRAFGIDYDEESAHRGDYDAEVLKDYYLLALLPELINKGIATTHLELSKIQSPEINRKMHAYHTNVLVKNAIGMKNLFRILSIANTEHFTDQALVSPSVIDQYKDGLLIGSSCARGEIFEIASTKSEDKLLEVMKWYDYIEIQPLDQYSILVDTEKVESMEKIEKILKFIIKCAEKLGKPIVATGDVHYVTKEEHIAREVFISTLAIGGGHHPLFDYQGRIREYPIQEFKTTNQMLDAFNWLGSEKSHEYVIDNPNKINDMIEYCYPIKNKLYPPSIANSDEQLRQVCYERVHKMYGKNLPEIVSTRLEHELECIIGNGYSIMYVIASKCVAHAAEKGFLVGSRGSVGSSFAATCAGITEVNPLKTHYRCPNCAYSDFSIDPTEYRSGFDLPDKDCPVCGHKLIGDGHNIPFETFLGFKGDKVPDIDLNFSSLNQADSHLYIREMFGEDHVFRAGTISKAASKTAFGYAKKYYETLGVEVRNAEAARIAILCEGVKRTTGQHPGGLIVIPRDMDVYDFTPVCHPADDLDSEWLTTHFAFEAIHDNVLKLDMLGHVDPTVIRMLELLTGIDPKSVPLNDPKVIAMFNGEETIRDDGKLTATGLPEFGTNVAKKMLVDTKPTTFADLTKISGLAHGTDVFFDNIRDYIINGDCNIVNCIGCRDDIMEILMRYGLDPSASFKLMEKVRKGKEKLTEDEIKSMTDHNVPEWFIGACKKIKYLFPKAHAVAYCLMAVRIAWFKLYYPLEYYAAYFTWRSDAYNIDVMVDDINVVKRKFYDLKNKQESEKLSVKEDALITFYEVAIEMYQRGMKFGKMDLYKSDSYDFVLDKENNALIPPFRVLDGLGDTVGATVVEARNEARFTSKEDLKHRTKLTEKNIKELERLKVLDEINETDQLTLF